MMVYVLELKGWTDSKVIGVFATDEAALHKSKEFEEYCAENDMDIYVHEMEVQQ